MMRKMLINGFPRSGTTYLYRYMLWRFKERVLFEPVFAPPGSIAREPIWKEARTRHPLYSFPLPYTNPLWFLYNENLLRQYMEFLRDYHIKEVTLHFYLSKEFIKENWEVYHIIRDPVSTFYSFKRLFIDKTAYSRLLGLMDKLKLKLVSDLIKQSYIPLFKMAQILLWDRLLPSEIKIDSFEEAFLIVWTLSNYEALKSIDDDHLIVYHRAEDYEKLKDFNEYRKVEELKIRTYDDPRLAKKFKNIAKKFKIDEEYEYLCKKIERC